MTRYQRLRAERGASAVEFAIVASLLFMVLFGTIQFGIAYNRYQGLQAGAREGARLGSLQSTSLDDIRARVRQSVSIIDGSNLADTCGPGAPAAVDTGCIQIQLRNKTTGNVATAPNPPCNANKGDAIIVNVKYKMDVPIPFFGSPQLTITGTGDFVCE